MWKQNLPSDISFCVLSRTKHIILAFLCRPSLCHAYLEKFDVRVIPDGGWKTSNATLFLGEKEQSPE